MSRHRTGTLCYLSFLRPFGRFAFLVRCENCDWKRLSENNLGRYCSV